MNGVDEPGEPQRYLKLHLGTRRTARSRSASRPSSTLHTPLTCCLVQCRLLKMASMLRSGKFVRFFSNVTRNFDFNNGGRCDADTQLCSRKKEWEIKIHR